MNTLDVFTVVTMHAHKDRKGNHYVSRPKPCLASAAFPIPAKSSRYAFLQALILAVGLVGGCKKEQSAQQFSTGDNRAAARATKPAASPFINGLRQADLPESTRGELRGRAEQLSLIYSNGMQALTAFCASPETLGVTQHNALVRLLGDCRQDFQRQANDLAHAFESEARAQRDRMHMVNFTDPQLGALQYCGNTNAPSAQKLYLLARGLESMADSAWFCSADFARRAERRVKVKDTPPYVTLKKSEPGIDVAKRVQARWSAYSVVVEEFRRLASEM